MGYRSKLCYTLVVEALDTFLPQQSGDNNSSSFMVGLATSNTKPNWNYFTIRTTITSHYKRPQLINSVADNILKDQTSLCYVGVFLQCYHFIFARWLQELKPSPHIAMSIGPKMELMHLLLEMQQISFVQNHSSPIYPSHHQQTSCLARTVSHVLTSIC